MLDHGVSAHARCCSMLGMQLLQYPAIVLTRRPAQLGDLAIALLEKYPRPRIEAKTLVAQSLVQLWYQPLLVCESVIETARKSAAANGIILFLSYILFFRASCWSVLLDVVELRAFIEQEILFNQIAANELVTALALQGQLLALRILEDPTIDDSGDFGLNQTERDFLVRAESVSYRCSTTFRVARARALYILDQAEAAMNLLLPIDTAIIPGMPESIYVVVFRVLSIAMVIRQRCQRAYDWSEGERRSLWAVVQADMEFFRVWWQISPSTHGGNYWLAEAEIAYTQLIERESQENHSDQSDERARICKNSRNLSPRDCRRHHQQFVQLAIGLLHGAKASA